ncbi:PREDICTED: translation initiation factor eIF-2B subunit delta-like isoform X3 [Camelina sativa]|uniref:Translation initiation factor eIF2B subunit delta n=1 Tax=Camelina sativa TaxID=90675 RepID=A0ABM0UGX7_CAMSA|nr:PREDICTED: translation initiation factor eIF-2B subunit delta-like isoform X3 [Camelina sativa]
MESRRNPRAVVDPKVRQVGFFTSSQPDSSSTQQQQQQTDPIPASASSPPVSTISPSGNSLSPVMIPPPRLNSSDTFPLRGAAAGASSAVSPSSFSYSNRRDFPDGSTTASPGRHSRGSFVKSSTPVASSLPGIGMDSMAAAKSSSVPASGLTTVSVVTMPPGLAEKASGMEVQSDQKKNPKSLKEKTTKAERRAIQEAQRAAKAAAKADGGKVPPGTSASVASTSVKVAKPAKPSTQKNEVSVAAGVTEKKGGPSEKDRKKDAPHPRMQYDDESRVVKAKRRAVVKQTEAKNRVELFRHLPQYEHGTQLPDLETKFFQLDPMHPAVYKVGLQYLSGDISGGNARCIAMLQAFQEVVKDYSTPPEKNLNRDMTAKISSYVSFLIECRPLSISMGNAIRFVKNRIAKLPITLSESEAKAALQSDIERFINDKIIGADMVIVKHAVTKIRDGDVLLTYGSPTAVEMILLHAHELKKKFRVLVVDSRPKLEGQLLLRRLIKRGISCTYTHINAISYIMHEVTKVFLGASSVLSNGTVYSRVGTACVAMVASAFRVPVLVCCEAYKFHERVQLDSICSNELGDPNAISKVHGREDINYLDGLTNNANLQFLNLMYDATPSDYISMIITDYGMVPPTSVPVIVREYQKEHLLV